MEEIVTNSKARRDYHVLETFEAGLVLKGTEVKALRAGKGQLSDAFARIENDQAWLHNAHIDEYAFGNLQNHQPKAPRKLLLHKSEIRKLFGLASVKGNARNKIRCWRAIPVLPFHGKSSLHWIEMGPSRGAGSLEVASC